MEHEHLKPKDKVVTRMTREGAVEENLTESSSERISQRLQEPELVKPQEIPMQTELPDGSDGTAKLHQTMAMRFQEQQEEASSAAAAPVAESGVSPPTASASSFASVAVSEAVRGTSIVEEADGSAILGDAARTAADRPEYGDIPGLDGKIQRLEQKSRKAHEHLDAAREKLPTHKVLRKERVFDEDTGKGKTRLYFEDELTVPKGKSKLQFEADKSVRKVGDTLASGIHGKLHEVEQENAGVEAAHKSEIAAESAVRHYSHHRQKAVNKPYEKLSKLEHEAQTADTKLHYAKTQQEHPEMKKQRVNMNKHYQKQNIKKEYAAARKAGTQTASSATKTTGKKAGEKVADKAKNFISKNKKFFLWFGLGLMVVLLLSAGISSCTAMFASTGSAVIATSYLSEDEAMLGAEAQYVGMETELQDYLDNYESTHSYDEYHFDLDEIEHDPYVLISILSALHEGEFTLSEVQGTLEILFEKQYILTEEVVVETRYRWETEYDSEGNPYQVRVPYDYYICYVTLENFDLSHVPVYIMSEDQLSMYSAYMSALGNREDLFPGSSYVDKYIENPPADYDVPAEYLDDATFSALLTEAEKYLGYPYVWGGSSPDTSFDCSGFVSYVLTNSGLVNTGRLGAQGLYNICTPISSPQPGDLVFFQGTYDTSGVSHVGIYVGDQVMLHCGDPIQYTSLNSSYWQSHFYAYGRPPY